MNETSENWEKIQTRNCSDPKPKYGGKNCSGSENKTEICRPVDGYWSKEEWSTCFENCTRSRLRTCDNPEPIFGGKYCKGEALEEEFCLNKDCIGNECYQFERSLRRFTESKIIDTVQKCQKICSEDETCVSFFYTLNKTCIFNTKEVTETNFKIYSPSILKGPKFCPIDGNWTEFDNFLPCKNGQERGFRTCSNPEPQHGGQECTGNTFIVRNCTEMPSKNFYSF